MRKCLAIKDGCGEVRLKDPVNNQLILYFAGENRLNPPWRINDN